MTTHPGCSFRFSPSERVGIYIHIPFCHSRCEYCAFTSGLYNEDTVDEYLRVLRCEYEYRQTGLAGRIPSTLFIGGGTPSSLTHSQLETLLSFLPFPDPEYGEATCELNPDSTDAEKLRILHDHGITRCSFGVQSFSTSGLHLLGRRHDASTAISAIETALKTGFQSVSLDLIMGWPGQTWKSLREDLRLAAVLGVSHLSCYQLILEEGSGGYARLSMMPSLSDEEEREIWDNTEAFLEDCGFEHYETSNFARPGYRCRHNVDTWKGCDYLGLGGSAHSHIGGVRHANTTDMNRYLLSRGNPGEIMDMEDSLSPEEKARECAVFWLRLFEGIERREFLARTGIDLFALYADTVPVMIRKGFLEHTFSDKDKEYIRVPKKYHPLLDSILIDLI